MIQYESNMFFHLYKGVNYKKNVSISRMIHHKKIAKKFVKDAEENAKPDLIIATMAPLEFSKAATDFANKYDIPVVVDIRDLWPEIYNEVVPSWGKKIIAPYIKLSKKRLKKILNNATSLVAVTDGFLDYGLKIAERKKTDKDVVFHTSYTIDSDIIANFDDEWAKYEIEKEAFIISFMGNFGKQFELKPIFEVAKSFEKNKSIKFVICGTGENYEYFKNNYGDLDNVIMPGWIEGKQIKSLLSNTNIGIAPYRDSKNFRLNAPNKFGEYLSYGLPILVSVPGEMEGLLDKYSCGKRYSNSLELKKAIETIYTDERRMNNMKKNAKQLYNDYFNSHVVYDNFSDYLVILASKKSKKNKQSYT